MDNYIRDFEACWQRFETGFRGKFLAKSKQQEITLGLANMLLQDAAECWHSMYDISGKWLINYEKENPDKGEIIAKILKKDLKFTHEVKQKSVSPNAKFIIPIVGALIGVGIAHVLSANLFATIASAAVPAAVLYSVTSGLEKNSAENGKAKMLDGYIAQLSKYKTSILNVLKN